MNLFTLTCLFYMTEIKVFTAKKYMQQAMVWTFLQDFVASQAFEFLEK